MKVLWRATVLAVSITISVQCKAAEKLDKPVKAVGDHALAVGASSRKNGLPFYASLDGREVELAKPQPGVTRVVIVIHGLHRNARGSFEAGERAAKSAGRAGAATLVMSPQFLEAVDVQAFHLPGDVLRWAPEAWMSGENALNAPISTFDALDSVLAHFGEKAFFPNLKTVVLAGHSAGGQFIQRYAVVGRGGDALARAGVRVRYVVANPSSYLYFSAKRPVVAKGKTARGDFTFAIPEKTCSGKYERWKYGLAGAPPYVQGDAAELEKRYVARDVRYLLGTKDDDPDHPELDKSCSGEAEGPFRLYRGKAYFRYLELRHPELAAETASQQEGLVPGVAHDVDRMLNSECGLAALFDVGACSTRLIEPKP